MSGSVAWIIEGPAQLSYADTLSGFGWRISCLANPPMVQSRDGPSPALVIVHQEETAHAHDLAIARLRTEWATLNYVPIIAVGRSVDCQSVSGADARIEDGVAEDEWREVIGRFTPTPNTTIKRLAGIFGEAEVRSLALGLRDTLIGALLDAGTGHLRTVAHRVAGLAGILGYDDLGAAWNAFDRGQEGALTVVRLSRRAINDIAQLTWP